MMNLTGRACESVHFFDMEPEKLCDFLLSTNYKLAETVKDENTYSYDVYWSLLVLTHNFRVLLERHYLESSSSYSYLEKKICSYFEVGGEREVLPYLLGIGKEQEEHLEQRILESKQQFVISTFYNGYQGLPERLKYFCEVPDFYPEITSDMMAKIYQKNR